MVKYTKQRKSKKSLRRTRRKVPKTLRRTKRRGGYDPVGPNGGNYGTAPTSNPVQSSGALPDPKSAFPDGPSGY
uniref:Uncharacterized protein n=1 Tax=viral metagenome TaxID=1070528 RepID=A0A6C0HM04_9ZZZZ